MTPEQMREIFCRHGTDKGTWHRYYVPYSRLLERYRALAPARLIEIGIHSGSSLRAWLEIFPKLQLSAVDVDPKTRENAPEGCTVYIGDQGDESFLDAVIAAEDPWDVVIDDGSHRIDHQKDTFDKLWPRVRPGGLYVIEDLQSSRAELYSTRAARRKNPRNEQTTLDRLVEWARFSISRQRRPRGLRLPPAMITFYFGACFIVKDDQ